MVQPLELWTWNYLGILVLYFLKFLVDTCHGAYISLPKLKKRSSL